MANKKITQLPVLTNSGMPTTSVFPVVDGDDTTTKQISVAELDTRWQLAQVNVPFVIEDNKSVYTDVTGFQLNESLNWFYRYEYRMIRTDGTNYRVEHGFLSFNYDPQNGWVMSRDSDPDGNDVLNMGPDSLALAASQLQYKSDPMGGAYQGKITWWLVKLLAKEF